MLGFGDMIVDALYSYKNTLKEMMDTKGPYLLEVILLVFLYFYLAINFE